MNLHTDLESLTAMTMQLDKEQEHGVLNAIQIVESAYRLLEKETIQGNKEYYLLRAEQFRMIAKNLELIGPPDNLLILAEAYERLARKAIIPSKRSALIGKVVRLIAARKLD